MSYILDALRKADAQRERDPARGIHAQAFPAAELSPARRFTGRPAWLAGGAVLAALLLAAGWLAWRGDPVQGTQTAAVSEPAHAPAPAAVAPVVGAGVVPAAAIQPPPAMREEPPRTQLAQVNPEQGRTARGTAAGPTGTPPTPTPAPAAPAAATPPPPPAAPPAPAPAAPAPPPLPAPVSPNTAAPAPVAPAPAVPLIQAAPQPPAPPAPANTPAPPTAGLPGDAPKIAISGGVYSTSPAQRMLIVNGQVFNEGSEIAPGVTVEEIKARTVVLKFKGSRYNIAY
ncbi:hypothetical protein GCM10027034_08340 [Ramlibacter solisilvae]|uniref:Type II secretion system protein GspB C-terminal domain-containing protein n=1 Tax=Ramlibacter tataouinensis TaxID=94132 RepID=A0A127K144_9BURK|nr:general secretion pathway protein GspB [Ramlibacter tataouinensis]AMO24802.1 hypothetical protein UC35_20655 [Ramlibacter tataouinensis]